MQFYDKSEITVNDVGLMAESLGISSSNRVQGIRSLGRKGAVQYTPNGNVESTISIDYYLETNSEPNFSVLSGLKSFAVNYTPTKISCMKITGSGYLQNYSIKIAANSPAKASVSYICYDELSGLASTRISTNFDSTQTSGLAHFWSTSLLPVQPAEQVFSDFEYSAECSWNPIFVLGQKTPTQVQLQGITERMSITRDVYKPITFSGQVANEYFDSVTNIALSGLEVIAGNATSSLTISISGAPVINSELSLNTQDYKRIKSSIERLYN